MHTDSLRARYVSVQQIHGHGGEDRRRDRLSAIERQTTTEPRTRHQLQRQAHHRFHPHEKHILNGGYIFVFFFLNTINHNTTPCNHSHSKT